MTDRIEKSIRLKVPMARVWRALTGHQEFGQWFRVKLDNPFEPGRLTTGQITYPGYEHLAFETTVQDMVAESLFSFTWHTYAVETNKDYAAEPMTLVEFRLEDLDEETVLTVTESGFDALPSERRLEAFRMNEGGWAEQMGSIQQHVEHRP